MSPENQGQKGRIVLLGSVFVVAACGLVYELVAGSVSSYLLGDAVTQFSLVIGVFLCAMGIGSYLSKFITRRLLETFVEIEIWVGLIGGLSSVFMFAVNVFAEPIFPVFFYCLCAFLGMLVGIEIPLLVRIINRDQPFADALSHVLALDYMGALAGAILFPLVALPWLGLSRSSVVFGLMNLAVAAVGIALVTERTRRLKIKVVASFCILMAAMIFSTRLVGFMEDLLYQDSVIYAKDTRYQRIVLTRWRSDVRLFLNGHIQFSSVDEARYHEALVIPAMGAAPSPKNVLILGGGDGLAAREVLKYESVEKIVLVDLDPEITRLASSRKELLALNNGSLLSPKVQVINVDAMGFLKTDTALYEVIIVDLPDPNTESMAKLYSRSFYALCAKRLAFGGVMVTQATSPYFAPEAFWCIAKTIEEAVRDHPDLNPLNAVAYHVHVPSFGEWGFVMGAKHKIDPATLTVLVPTKFLTDKALAAMFVFGKDMQPLPVEENRLDDPILYQYYKQGWQRYNGS